MILNPKTEFTFPQSSFSSKQSIFSIGDEFISLDGKSMQISEISSMRYGIKTSRIYHFYSGVQFLIDLKDKNDQELNIRMNSFFFVKKKLFSELFENIATVIWETLADKIIQHKLSLLENDQSFSIGNCEIKPEGILIDNKHLIGWHECYIQKNYDQLVINSKKDHTVYTYLPYAEHWDVFILAELAEHILDPSKIKQKA